MEEKPGKAALFNERYMMQKKFHWMEFIADRSVMINEDQTILEASLQAGIPHYHACGGQGQCTTCRILVRSGQDFLTPPSEKELNLRTTIPLSDNIRMACQTKVKGGPISVHRMIRDEADIKMYVDEDIYNDIQNTGQEKELSLFFLDIKNFTPFIEKYLAFDVIHIVRRLFSLFRQCIEHHNGRIIETAGDGFYAVFGFETSAAESANQAFAAAKAILFELEELNNHYIEKNFFHSFEAGIGLHIGKVIVGNIGIGVNNNLTVMGLPVNIASRLQTSTRRLDNSLVTSQVFYDLLHPKPDCQTATTSLKGITESIEICLCGNPYRK